MKRFCTIICLAMAVFTTVTFSSCGKSDDPNKGGTGDTRIKVNPKNVFTAGLPQSVAGMRIHKDANGLVKLINGEGGTVSFQYKDESRAIAPAPDVIMTVESKEESSVYKLYLNAEGFVKYATHTTTYRDTRLEPENGQAELSYDNDGHLVSAKIKGEETWKWSYKNGDLVKAECIDAEDTNDVNLVVVHYTSDKVTSPIPNKGCLMLYDLIIPADIDELIFAYYAGILGKATKHLPVRCVGKDENDTAEILGSWKLNETGLPVSLKYIVRENAKIIDEDELSFTW